MDRLSASINTILPDGFRVERNRRPDLLALHAASQAEREEWWQERGPKGTHSYGGFISVSVYRLPKGQPSRFARRMADEPDLLFVAPPDARHASGSFVHGYFDEEAPWGESSDENQRLLAAALHVLDDLQDSICEGAREPWPNEGVAPVPSLRGEVVGRELRLWFEDARGTVLTLPEVPLD